MQEQIKAQRMQAPRGHLDKNSLSGNDIVAHGAQLTAHKLHLPSVDFSPIPAGPLAASETRVSGLEHESLFSSRSREQGQAASRTLLSMACLAG